MNTQNTRYDHDFRNNDVAVAIELERLEPLLSEKQRRHEAKMQRLEQLQGDVDRHNEAVQGEIDRVVTRHDADLEKLDPDIERAKEAYSEARKHAAEAEASLDDLEVTPPSAVLRRLGLPGAGLSVKTTRMIKPVLTLASIFVSGFSLGVVTRVLTPKHLLDRPDGIVLSLIFGAAISLGVWMLSAQGWGLYGRRVGSRSDARQMLWPLVALTVVMLTSFAYLDGHAIYVLNATRATFSPELRIDTLTSLLIGACLSGLYIGGLCLAGYVDGYNAAVAETVQAEQDLELQAARSHPVHIGRAYEARRCRAKCELAKARLEELEERRRRMFQEFELRRAELKKDLKVRPEHLAEDDDDRRLDGQIERQKLCVHAETMRSGGSLS